MGWSDKFISDVTEPETSAIKQHWGVVDANGKHINPFEDPEYRKKYDADMAARWSDIQNHTGAYADFGSKSFLDPFFDKVMEPAMDFIIKYGPAIYVAAATGQAMGVGEGVAAAGETAAGTGTIAAEGGSALMSAEGLAGVAAPVDTALGAITMPQIAGGALEASTVGGAAVASAAGGASSGGPVDAIITGGQSGAANAAGSGFTYDTFGNVIPNEMAESIVAKQTAEATAANLANGLTATGGLTPAQYQAVATAAAAKGWTAAEIASAVKNGGSALNSLLNVVGAYQQYGAAKGAGAALGGAAIEAGNNLAAASKEAAGLQSKASTDAAKTLSDAATGSANRLGDAYTAGGIQLSGTDLATAGITGRDYLATGRALSDADLSAANTLASGYGAAGAARVAGLNESIGTARQTLATQTENQKPYMSAGTQALAQLMEGLKEGGQFNRQFTMADAHNSEAYKFALGEGQDAVKRNSAVGGMQLSSAGIESLTKHAEGTAAQFQQQAFNQWMAQNNMTLSGLQNMVNTGQVSTAQLQQALAQAGISIETFQKNIGEANADAIMGAAGANAQGSLASAGHLANSQMAASGALTQGMKDSTGHVVSGNINAANALSTGELNAGQATAAGQVGSAGYTASGITDAAKAQAAGLVASTNATTAGNVAGANIKSTAITDVANILDKTGATKYLMGDGNSFWG